MSHWIRISERPRRAWAGSLHATLLMVSLAVLLVPAAPAGGQDDFERLEQLLARLGLDDLQVAQLEQTLRSSAAAQRKQQVAQRLADLYAERLMASSDDKARYDETLQRITALVRDYPQANTTALQVMLLQADYSRAESLIATWTSEPQDSTSRDEALQILTRITPLLMDHQGVLNKQVEEWLHQTEDITDADVLQTKELELRRIQAIAARATYFAAWSSYYVALVTNASERAPPYVQARDIFLRLLGFDEELPADLEPEWLGLESVWRARAVIGLGLSLAACGEMDASERCFDLLEHASVAPEIKEQAPYWHVRALFTAGQLERAGAYARRQIDYFQPPPTQGRVSLCVALIREGFADKAAKPNPLQRELGNLGLIGLARLGQLDAISKLIEKYQITAEADSGFVLHWAAGQQQFAEAEKSQSESDYETAAQTLATALKSSEANSLAGAAARCRYTLAWCYYRLDQLEQAGRAFSNAFPGLHESKDPLAVETAWMAFVSYRRLAASQPRLVTTATDALKRLEQYFPDHSYAQRARYEMTKLLETTDPLAMISQLEAIPPGSENYALARYDLCLLRHRLWTQQRGDADQAKQWLEALRAAADTYLKTVASDAQRKLKVSLLVADGALHHTEPDADVAAAMLVEARRYASQLPESNPLTIEYHYRELELAALKNDPAQRRRQAQWITEHADGSPYEQAALVIVANAIDQQIRAAGPDQVESLNRQAYGVYRRLVELLGNSEQKLADSKNAQVSISRLAHYAQEIGQPAEAADLWEQLLKIRPRDRRYLQRAAMAHSLAGQHPQALTHWRMLLSGLPSGTDAWYEAKYHQLESLANTDPQQARKVYGQFQLLHPDLGGERWRARFTDLARNW